MSRVANRQGEDALITFLPAGRGRPGYHIQLSWRIFMTKEVVRHKKDEKKKPLMNAKEKKAKKQEKKQAKNA